MGSMNKHDYDIAVKERAEEIAKQLANTDKNADVTDAVKILQEVILSGDRTPFSIGKENFVAFMHEVGICGYNVKSDYITRGWTVPYLDQDATA